ncbi:hypothetical protein EGR_11175 [Echinococcus granulosus]|uniref:Uncharacterized protein n=1 Tax=Echinococcus granulosus TaxID=6210 RepID=W6TZ30_ECHGR|nr:hypothetical protein EGR_11175 [Echinococcus granulosus]EUB53968.1 hypothetical protein EGR_11175 [Echinococcus granulosus]
MLEHKRTLVAPTRGTQRLKCQLYSFSHQYIPLYFTVAILSSPLFCPITNTDTTQGAALLCVLNCGGSGLDRQRYSR